MVARTSRVGSERNNNGSSGSKGFHRGLAFHKRYASRLTGRITKAGMVRLLLDAGPEVDARDDWGRTALFYAPVLSEVFEALHNAGADLMTATRKAIPY